MLHGLHLPSALDQTQVLAYLLLAHSQLAGYLVLIVAEHLQLRGLGHALFALSRHRPRAFHVRLQLSGHRHRSAPSYAPWTWDLLSTARHACSTAAAPAPASMPAPPPFPGCRAD